MRRSSRGLIGAGIAFFAIAASFFVQGKTALGAAFIAIGIALIAASRRRTGGGDAR